MYATSNRLIERDVGVSDVAEPSDGDPCTVFELLEDRRRTPKSIEPTLAEVSDGRTRWMRSISHTMDRTPITNRRRRQSLAASCTGLRHAKQRLRTLPREEVSRLRLQGAVSAGLESLLAVRTKRSRRPWPFPSQVPWWGSDR